MMTKKVDGGRSVFSYPSLRILLLKIKEIKRKIIFIPLEDLDLSLTGFIPLQAAGLSNGVNLVFWKNLPITYQSILCSSLPSIDLSPPIPENT